MAKDNFSNEIVIYILSGIFLAFAFTNFKPEVASGLQILLFVSFMIIITDYLLLDNKLSIPMRNPSVKLGTSVGMGVIFGIAFILVGSSLTRLSLQATLGVFLATIPSFAKSVVLTFITWVIVLVFIETITAVRVAELMANRIKVNIFDLKNPVVWVIIGVIGFTALLLHATAYGVTNNKALFLSLLFFSSGIVLSIKMKEAMPFIVGHGVVNGLAFVSG